jgi:phage shock protein PspC (stress-responsive transcriptional regulator)
MAMGGLYRSRRNRVLAGVAGGMADRFGVPTWIVRLVWVILMLPGGLPGVLPYLLLWVLMPLEPKLTDLDRYERR